MARIDRKAVMYGLRWLNNPVRLQQSPLLNLRAIQQQAQTGQTDRFMSTYALRDLITAAVQQVLAMQTTDRTLVNAQAFLRKYLENPHATQVAHDLNFSRAYLYKTVRETAIELLVDELRAQVSDS